MAFDNFSPTPRHSAVLRRPLRVLLAVALAGSLFSGCGDSNRSDADPSPAPAPTTTTPTAPPTPDHSDAVTDVPTGEVWQWAFGQNVWDDPLYTLSQEQHFSPGNTDIYANTMGFSLTPDDRGTVQIVTLFNEGTGMVAYPGQLPGGLDWSMTGGDLLDMLGQDSLSAIDGVPFYFNAVTSDGYDLDVYVAASHQEELSDALMTSIIVRPLQ